jgi:flavin-dependent dehydrogenase
MRDAIVIGARCAGATTALVLARRGLDVLLVDRAAFPSEVPHGHFIHQSGPARLAELGLLERVLGTGCPPVTTITTDFGDGPLTGRGLVRDRVPLGLGPRRGPLDRVLVEAAAAAGAEVHERFAVDELVADRDRVVGVRGREVVGRRRVTERTRLVIGADGRNSAVARAVDAPLIESVPTLTCWYFSYWSGVPSDGILIAARQRRVVFAFPTNDDLTAIFIAWPIAELPQVRADLHDAFMAALEVVVPELAERVRDGRREERYAGAAQLPNFLRRPHGPGWALVGDAGCHKDPLLALGLCDALRDACLLGEAAGAGLTGSAPLDEALAGYERQRDEATLPDYHRNILAARLRDRPPDELALRAALRGRQDDIDHFYRVRQGMAPRESFFNDANLARIMAAATA